jgi:hypothetical protein
MVVKDHEGKTSGSVLHDLVYAHECALQVNFRIHDVKKNPSGHTRYLEKYWNPVTVSPKCGKRLDYARYRIQVRGLEFELGSKFQAPGLLTKIPLRKKRYETCKENTERKEIEDLIKSKIRRFAIQPKSTILVESRGLLTRV